MDFTEHIKYNGDSSEINTTESSLRRSFRLPWGNTDHICRGLIVGHKCAMVRL